VQTRAGTSNTLVIPKFIHSSLVFHLAILYSSLFPSHTDIQMKKIYKVTLTTDERALLTKLVSTGKSSAQKIKHANI